VMCFVSYFGNKCLANGNNKSYPLTLNHPLEIFLLPFIEQSQDLQISELWNNNFTKLLLGI